VKGQVVVFGCGTHRLAQRTGSLRGNRAESAHGDVAASFFWIGGSTPDEQAALAKQIAARHLEEHVRFLGERPNPRPYLALGQIFVLSSREDPFPLVALEAASAGCRSSASKAPAECRHSLRRNAVWWFPSRHSRCCRCSYQTGPRLEKRS